MSGRCSSPFLQTKSYCTMRMYLHKRPMSCMKCENISVTQLCRSSEVITCVHTSPRRGHGRRGQCVCSNKLSSGTTTPIHCSCTRRMLWSSAAGKQACGMCVADSSKLEMHLGNNVLRVGKLRQRADASLAPVACLGHGYLRLDMPN